MADDTGRQRGMQAHAAIGCRDEEVLIFDDAGRQCLCTSGGKIEQRRMQCHRLQVSDGTIGQGQPDHRLRAAEIGALDILPARAKAHARR